jgi:recombination protein RecT
MSTELQKTNQTPIVGVKALSNFLNSDSIKSKFAEVLGDKDKGVAFVTSILSVVNSNGQLANADQNSLYTAALMAATLDLPINPSIGHSFLVPFNTKQADGTYKTMVQFQISAKGLKQLAMRSGQFLKMNDSDVREGEIESVDRMTGEIKFNWIQDDKERLAKPVVGFISYFKLQNGFESTFYMTKEEVELHAKKFSQTYKKFGTGLWKDMFEKMASKTVIKLHLSKDAPLSTSVQKALISDQAVIKNDKFANSTEETVDVETEYVDHQEVPLDVEAVSEAKQRARIVEHIANAKDMASLEQVKSNVDPETDLGLFTLYDDKARELKGKK